MCLHDLTKWAVNGAVSLCIGQTGVADFTVFVGEAPKETDQGPGIVAIGNGWNAWLGEISHAPANVAPTSSNPLGPFLGAALAAGEVFKRGRGIRRGRFLSSDGFSLWSGASAQHWNDLEDGPELTAATLPPIHLVGAGAVGNALAYVIANLGLAERISS